VNCDSNKQVCLWPTDCNRKNKCLRVGSNKGGPQSEYPLSDGVQATPEPREVPVQSPGPDLQETRGVEAHSSPDGDKQEALDSEVLNAFTKWIYRRQPGLPDPAPSTIFAAGWNAHAELVTHECAFVGTVDGARNNQSGTAEKSGSASPKQNDLSVLEQLEKWLRANPDRQVKISHSMLKPNTFFVDLFVLDRCIDGSAGPTILDCLQDKTIQEVINP
jgi:hypothetical protein